MNQNLAWTSELGDAHLNQQLRPGTELELSRWDPTVVCPLVAPVDRLEDLYVVPSTSRRLLLGPDKWRPPGSALSVCPGTVQWELRVLAVGRDSIVQPEALAANWARQLGRRSRLLHLPIPGSMKGTMP